MRAVREGDNVRGSDVRLAVRVGCSRSRASAVPEEWPSRIVLRKRGGALQNPAYRPADVLQMRGSARRAPRHSMLRFIGSLELVPTFVPTIYFQPDLDR